MNVSFCSCIQIRKYVNNDAVFVWGNGFPYPVSLKPSLQRYGIDTSNFVIAGNMSILLSEYPYEENQMLGKEKRSLVLVRE